MKDYVMEYLENKLTICEAYANICDEIAKTENKWNIRKELHKQKELLQYHMARELMYIAGFRDTEKERENNSKMTDTIWKKIND